VDRIGKSITGEVQLDLTHFPVDANLASVVAQEVNAATGTGLLLPTGLSGITCDVNSSSDTSVPGETFTTGSFPDYGSNLDGLDEGEDFGDAEPTEENPEDGLDNQENSSNQYSPPFEGYPAPFEGYPAPFEGYPAPGDGRFPPDAPAGIVPVLMGNGQPAPGYPPTEWIPGTWSSTFEIPAHQDTIYGDLDPSAPGLQCGIVQVNNIPSTGTVSTSGPNWGLYRTETDGLCGAPSYITWYTAVIGNGFSYWQVVATFGGGPYGTDTTNPIIGNVFTPL
jgi:hypothetical protein